VYRKTPRKKLTKEQALKAIRRWKFKPAMSWEELRAMTRES
jgi:outer membrane biosynthesis protein TonB